MKTSTCVCGQRLFPWNTACLRCSRELGFDPERLALVPLDPDAPGVVRSAHGDGTLYRHCQHREAHVCNWLVRTEADETLCLSCGLTAVIPNLGSPGGRARWEALEDAKRAVLVTLLTLGLPVVGRNRDRQHGLAFAFLDDRTSNPDVLEETVVSGHGHGLITINAREADAAERERIRVDLSEPYRTLLGHFRHETGHYYWFRLVEGTEQQAEFRELFGDESADYERSLASHYAAGPPPGWSEQFVSAYAAAHPHEDWAESWAHYLHLTDTLETALEFGLVDAPSTVSDFDGRIDAWRELAVALNALNRSMGLPDAYPFVLSSRAAAKLAFVSRVAAAASARGGAQEAHPSSA